MGWRQQELATGLDSITTYYSPAAPKGAQSGAATLGCNDEMVVLLTAIVGATGVIQSASKASGGNVSSLSQAFGSPNTAGNTLVVDCGWGGIIAPQAHNITISDTQGNTYITTPAVGGGTVRQGVPGGNTLGVIFVALTCAAGPNTVTVTIDSGGTSTSATIAIHEYALGSGVDGDLSFDGSTHQSNHGTAVNVGGGTATAAQTTTSSGDLLHMAVFISPACAGSPSNPSGGSPLSPPFPSPNWLIINEPSIGFTDRTSYLWKGSGNQHSWTQELRQRGQATIHLYVAAGDTYTPTRGSPVYLFDQIKSGVGWQLVFSGLIEDLEYQYFDNSGDHFVIITAVSLESVFDTVYAQPMQFVNQTCGAILTAVFNAFENGCQVSLGSISAGTIVPLFNTQIGQKLSEIFNQLATTSEFTWNVNPATQQLFFGAPNVTAAPFTLAATDILWENETQLTWKLNGRDYRNRQAIRLSDDAFPQSGEVFIGAGQQSFTLRNPVKQVVKAYVTIATPNFATGTFTGQPSPGDTITIGPQDIGWAFHSSLNPWLIDTVIVVSGYVFQCTFAGASAATQPPAFLTQTTAGDTVIDGVAIWTCLGPYGTGAGVEASSVYTFVSTLDNTQPFEVLIGGTLAATIQNLVDAINAQPPYGGPPYTSGKGYTVSLPTWEGAQVNATVASGTQITVTNKQDALVGVSALAAVSANFSWSGTQTAGGSFPQGSVGPNEPGTIEIQVYAEGTSTAAPGLAYTEGSAVVTLATPLNSGTNLNVWYYRSDAGVIEVENTSLVTALAVVTHGTGKYQQYTDQSSQGLISTSAQAGLQLAQQILEAYSVAPQEFSFTTYRYGLQTGQELNVSLIFPAIAGTIPVLNQLWVIESIEAELVTVTAGTGAPWLLAPNYGHYKYTIKAVNIQEIASYLDFWEGLGGGGSGSSGLGGTGPLAATSGGPINTQGNYGTTIEVNGTPGSGDSSGIANLESGSGVTVTDLGGGNYQFSSGATPTASTFSVVWDETPSGTVNGSNTAFTLANAPSPAASLQLFQNGILAIQGTDYALSGTGITFTSAPSTGAILNAFYRYGSTAGIYVDDETPGGAVNGSNVTFTLAHSPSPANSLKLYDNGVLQIQGTDYTLAGAMITFSNAPSTGDEMVAYYVYSLAPTNFADNETPSGAVNGTNVTFTLAHPPNPATSLLLYVNGVLQLYGADFTLSGSTITMTNAPSTGAILTAFYRYI